MEKEKEPGSARFGNFINYYSFNPPERRLQLIPKTLLNEYFDCNKSTLNALDIGSNAGNLTLELYNHLTDTATDLNLVILGVDVDPVLVERSIMQSKEYGNMKVSFRVADVLSEEDRSNVIGSFLRVGDLVRPRFDVVFSFSVTMWIHLNHGDQGLKNFLRYLSSTTDLLLIEPQPWRCYLSASRRMVKLGCTPFKHFSTLVWRETIVEEIIRFLESEECSMKLVRSFGHTESWDRPLCLFRSTLVDS